MQLRRKRFDKPDEPRTVDKAQIELVELGERGTGVQRSLVALRRPA